MHNIQRINIGDIITTVAAFLGAITGSIAFIWKILDHFRFELEVYSHYLSAEYSEKASKAFLEISKKGADLSKYSDNAIILDGWFKLLLRLEGKRYRSHRVSLFTIEPKKKLKKLLKKIVVDSFSDITLFCNSEEEYPQLSEGLPKEIEVRSNPIFLKVGWENEVDNPEQTTKEIAELFMGKNYNILIQLTTYKFPFAYVKGKYDIFHRESPFRRLINALRRFLRI